MVKHTFAIPALITIFLTVQFYPCNAANPTTKPNDKAIDLSQLENDVRLARIAWDKAKQDAQDKWKKTPAFAEISAQAESAKAAVKALPNNAAEAERNEVRKADREASNKLKKMLILSMLDDESQIRCDALLVAYVSLMKAVDERNKLQKLPQPNADGFGTAIASHQILPEMTLAQVRQSLGTHGHMEFNSETRQVYEFTDWTDSKTEPAKKTSLIYFQNGRVLHITHE